MDDVSLLTVDRFLDELGAVSEGLGLERPHVYGHSWGAMLGLQYAAERNPDWTSLICANGLASVNRFEAEVRDLMRALPGDVLGRTYGRELRGETNDPDYWAAQGEYVRACVLRTSTMRLDPELMSMLTFRTMIGSTGNRLRPGASKGRGAGVRW
ncbi:alpha/beta fold hydrolase [Streptomyces iranensis]